MIERLLENGFQLIEKLVELSFTFGVADGLFEGESFARRGDDVGDVVFRGEFQIVDAFVETPEAGGEFVRISGQGQKSLQLVFGQQEEPRVLQTLVLHQILQILFQLLDLLDAHVQTFVHPLGVQQRKDLFALTNQTQDISPVLHKLIKVIVVLLWIFGKIIPCRWR